MEVIEHYVGHNFVMELLIVLIVLMKKVIFVVSLNYRIFIFNLNSCFFLIERCINNLYSCPPKDDIRCDLACKMLHYVPCQTIQDHRACNNMQKDCTKYKHNKCY